MTINRLTRTFSLLICLMLMLSCAAQRDAASTIDNPAADNEVKLSIFEKLKEYNHFPIEERIQLYHTLKKKEFTVYNFKDERELTLYGYSLLEEKKTKEAIEIFKLLVSEFPNSFNAYDSLGEAYLKDENDALSLMNYEKSLELNPKNTGAIDAITRLKGLEILVTDWGKEIFHFPINFAPDINYEGVEEVVFPKNWSRADSSDFWSYVFVWALDNKTTIEASELEITLKTYFDGLMSSVNQNKEAEINKTEAYFQDRTSKESTFDFTGQLTIYDAFFTKKPLDLNCLVTTDYCEERKKLIVLFQFSPKEYSHPTWDLLRTVTVRSTVCEK